MRNSLNKYEKRQQRGQISTDDIKQYNNLSINRLLELLHSQNAHERTIGATIIGNRKLTELTLPLCELLRTETHLYARIAMSESLGKMGKSAVIPLISLLGKIGSNQETSLPLKYFNKKSYPLPRDLAARTVTKLGTIAIPELTKIIKGNDGFDTQQAIDALGSIVSRINDKSSLPVILNALTNYSTNEITTWKIVRALSGFKFIEAISPLLLILQSRSEAAIRWEAIRSIGQIGIASSIIMEILNMHLNDCNVEIRKASEIAIEQLIQKQ